MDASQKLAIARKISLLLDGEEVESTSDRVLILMSVIRVQGIHPTDLAPWTASGCK